MTHHRAIIDHIKDAFAKDGHKHAVFFQNKTDEQIAHIIFFSFRGSISGAKGMRLSWLGMDILSSFFRPYEITMPEGYKIKSLDLIYMDRVAKLPYYIGRDEEGKGDLRLVVFEPKLGVLLKLTDGSIEALRKMDG